MIDLSKSYDFFQPEKDAAMVHIVGCGSVGSTVAENLARCGVTKMTLWDFDKVESKNIVNQMFREKDIGKPKVEALADILSEINPGIEKSLVLKPQGWNGQLMSGYVFLAVDDIELRRKIVEAHMASPYVRAMFDFRTRLEDAQHYAADWSDPKSKQSFLNSMQFSNDEADDDTEISACGITLGVAPTVRIVCAYGVANYINFVKGLPLKQIVFINAFRISAESM